jgi:hypothetical protein
VFPNDLAPFATWRRASIALALNDGDTIDKDMVHSMPPKLEAMSYQTMYAYGNQFCVASAKEHLTSDRGVVATFEQECILGPNDQRLILAKLDYVG